MSLGMYISGRVAGGVYFCKAFIVKKLRQISVVGMGLLGASASQAILRTFSKTKTVGYSHRAVTRKKARNFGVADEIVDDIAECVAGADIVILATPIRTFEGIFEEIAGHLPDGCIVTDVGSTKVLPHRWARKLLSKNVFYVGSHPIAGSEKRGVEFARDDLFAGSSCILTKTAGTDMKALAVLRQFWSKLGCSIKVMAPDKHDRIFGRVSHLPHVAAAALINASDPEQMKFAGKGFVDTSRVASGPENVWADILLTNADNVASGIDRVIKELSRLRKAVKDRDQKQIEKLLTQARSKRAALIKYKMKKKELL